MKVLFSQDPDKTITTISIITTSSLSPIVLCDILQEVQEKIRSSIDVAAEQSRATDVAASPANSGNQT